MKPDQAEIVKEFQLQLDGASFVLGPINDDELGSWLFKPGSDRMRLLRWCLVKLNASLKDLLQNCDENEAEKSTIEQVMAFGLSSNKEVILGTTELNQCKFWRRVLALLKCSDNSKLLHQNTKPGNINLPASYALSKDFKNLLNSPVTLIPSHMCLKVSAVSTRNIDSELQNIVQELEELHEVVNNISSDDLEDVDRSVHTCDEYRETFEESMKKIQECYDHIRHTVFPAVKRLPENTMADVLGCYVENLADNVISFVQMLKSSEDIHKTVTTLQTKANIQCPKSSEPTELQQSISKCHSLVIEILSLWKVHKLVQLKD